MSAAIDTEIVRSMRPLFGEFAVTAFEQQKAHVGLGAQPTQGDYMRLAEAIRSMCAQVAGDGVASKIYAGLLTIVQGASS